MRRTSFNVSRRGFHSLISTALTGTVPVEMIVISLQAVLPETQDNSSDSFSPPGTPPRFRPRNQQRDRPPLWVSASICGIFCTNWTICLLPAVLEAHYSLSAGQQVINELVVLHWLHISEVRLRHSPHFCTECHHQREYNSDEESHAVIKLKISNNNQDAD